MWLALVIGCERGPEPEPGPEPAPELEPQPEQTGRERRVQAEPRPAIVEPELGDPGRPQVPASHRLDAPTRYEHLLLRAGLPVAPRYADLVYEGNNKAFRGEPDADGLYRSGADTAADWRAWAAGVKGLVVLRDSLFSQQDHPVLQAPHALMLPPNWVTVAVAEVLAGRVPVAPRGAELAIADDSAWAAGSATGGTGDAAAQAYFGSFPASARLFADASRPLAGATPAQQAMTRNARASMQQLGAAVAAMIAAAPHGAEQVAATGAAWIAASDRAYFGAELRREVILPIFVEHPNEHEARDEGKGLGVWGVDLPEQAITITRKAVYGRRLRDGALAIERYDLRYAPERARAIAVLTELIPRGSTGYPIWLWVNGGSDGHGSGDPAVPYIEDFRAELAAADVELSRVILLSKPSVRPWGDEAAAILEAETDRYAALGIPLSVQLSTRSFARLVEARVEE